jgi:uncharacterized ferritin-like protein (DUF455 family)
VATVEGWFGAARRCLEESDPAAKCAAVRAFDAAFRSGGLARDDAVPVRPIGEPGRPERPPLVDPARVPRRRLGSAEGRAALVHAVAHIEFNAINLALDAVYRFRGMPREYYRDWLSVAVDEARHFERLGERLRALGHAYGDFPAHDGLWDAARKTADRCLVRMALVPRVLEARGLDVTPGMIERLRQVGDEETVAVLEVILEEEVRHVAIGTHWFRHCCREQGVDPLETFLGLLRDRYEGLPRGPFNVPARRRAGFTEQEMAALTAGLEA